MRSFIFNLSRFYDVFIYEILLFFREKQPIYNSICPQFLKYSYLVKTILKGAFLSPFGLLSDKPLKWKHLTMQKVSLFCSFEGFDSDCFSDVSLYILFDERGGNNGRNSAFWPYRKTGRWVSLVFFFLNFFGYDL